MIFVNGRFLRRCILILLCLLFFVATTAETAHAQSVITVTGIAHGNLTTPSVNSREMCAVAANTNSATDP
jgi:hypothetical protein